MARTAGTTARTQRLTALVAILLVALAVGFAFGRVFLGHGATYRLLAVSVASALVAWAFERRSLLLATAVRAQSQAGFLTGLLESPDMPHLQLMLANRPTAVMARRDGVATMTAPDSEVRLEARSSREGPFEFVVRGVFDADKVREPAADDRVMYFHYKYLYESTGRRVGAGLYVVELEDPKQGATVARAIDGIFENSEAETKSETEAAFRADFLAMIGNLALLLNSIGLAVIFTILLVTANTMSMAVRERRTEIAVLKTLGFTSRQVMGLILAEALTIGALGGGIGLGLSVVIMRVMTRVPAIGGFINGFPNFGPHWSVSGQGLGIALFLGLAAGLMPALAAYRSRITEMLRQV